MKPVRKAVLPVAGLGTRVLPAGKTVTKNLLNVFDRPILSYVVAEAARPASSTSSSSPAAARARIEDYFDHHVELEAQLEAKGKTEILAEMRAELARPGR